MDAMEMFRQIGVFALLTLIVDILPLVAAAAFVARPTEARLALMRPFSLAGVFAGTAGTFNGLTAILRGIAVTSDMTGRWGRVAAGMSEALVTTTFAFTCLTVAWLLVAVGMWRGIREA